MIHNFLILIGSAPEALNTLNELADALNDDSNYATTTQNQSATQQHNIDNVPGTGEILLESDFLKRIFGVSPLNVNTYFNSNDANDPKNANVELSVDLSSYATTATTYTKTELDNSLLLKANQSTTYNKTEVDTLIAGIPLNSYYTKTQLDTMFSTVFNYCYSQSEADVLLNLKANQSTTYTKTEVDTLIAGIPLSSYYTKHC